MGFRVLPLTVALLTAVVLAGCTPGVEPTPPPTSAPTGEPTEPPQGGPMDGTLPISCDELLPAAVRAEAFGAAASDAAAEPSDATAGLWQSGLFECRWVLPAGAGDLRVWVLSDAETAYAEAAAASGGTVHPGMCSQGEFDVQCALNGLIDGYWFELSGTTTAEVDPAALTASLRSAVEAALAAAGPPRERWAPPADAAALPTDCIAYDGDEFHVAALSWDLARAVPAEQMYGSIVFETNRRAGTVVCHWPASHATGLGEFELVSLQGVTGSGWWWEQGVAAWEESFEVESLDIPGADGAVMTCQAGSCRVHLLVDGTVVSATFQRYDETLPDRARILAVLEVWTTTILGA